MLQKCKTRCTMLLSPLSCRHGDALSCAQPEETALHVREVPGGRRLVIWKLGGQVLCVWGHYCLQADKASPQPVQAINVAVATHMLCSRQHARAGLPDFALQGQVSHTTTDTKACCRAAHLCWCEAGEGEHACRSQSTQS